MAGADAHGDDACIDPAVHYALLVHRFDYAANSGDGVLSEAPVAAMGVDLADDFFQCLLADDLEHTVEFSVFFEAVDKVGQFPIVCELLE